MTFNNLRDKIPKKFVAFILALMLVVLSPFVNLFSTRVSAASGTITVWRSNSNEIGRWINIPSRIYVTKLNDNDDTFPFKLGMREAVSQWNGASLGSTMSYYYTPEEASGADIHYFGGTREEILDVYCFSESDFTVAQNTHGSVAGHTQCSRYEMDSWTYSGNGLVKTGYVIDYVRGFVLDYERELTTASRNKYYKTCTHE